MGYIRRHWQTTAMAIVVAAALLLGFWGEYLYFSRLGEARPIRDIGYFVLQLFALESGEIQGIVPWQLATARLLGAGVAFWAVMRAWLLLFGKQFQIWRIGFRKKHVVICGLGRKGFQMVEEFLEKGFYVIAIERNRDNPNIERSKDLGAVTIIGDIADASLLFRSGATRARYVFLVTGDDGTNVAAAIQLHRLKAMKSGKSFFTTCIVHVVDLYLCELFKQHSLFRDDTDLLEVRIFNMFENAARLLVADNPLEGRSLEEQTRTPHLIVLGFGQMGKSVALQAAKTAHYISGIPLDITIIDREANHLRDVFFGSYPNYPKICNTEFIQDDVSSADIIARLVSWSCDLRQKITVVVCLDDDASNLEAAMRLAAQLHGYSTPIYVRMSEATGLAALFEDRQHISSWLKCLAPFAMICQTCKIATVLENDLDILAKAIHEAYIELQKGGDSPASLPWEKLAPTFRDSNRQQADHIPVKLRAVGCKSVGINEAGDPFDGFSEQEIDSLAKMEHLRWSAERFLAGWTYGPARNPERKTSPCLVDWAELTDEMRENDRNTVRMIPQFLSRINMKIVRISPGRK